eukprot:MONOS_7730.1-p1 / transcript=MONOS_7730.1 / gene=MONOS_7730 / organism=Monocercomonoides_exilis_PA203 / gene_product=unspecified product / transcript_product=unspecified product / location=Mono_scaffold00272:24257-26418(+) / protein_length=640 / sequence_SO=supercontig / SO=protein_coding / is_pseudo=false
MSTHGIKHNAIAVVPNSDLVAETYSTVSFYLSVIAQQNSQEPIGSVDKAFASSDPPSLSIAQYLKRTLLAVKYLDDKYYPNTFYATRGGVHVQELNQLEYTFFIQMQYKLFVDPDSYNQFRKNLLQLSTVPPQQSLSPRLAPRPQTTSSSVTGSFPGETSGSCASAASSPGASPGSLSSQSTSSTPSPSPSLNNSCQSFSFIHAHPQTPKTPFEGMFSSRHLHSSIPSTTSPASFHSMQLGYSYSSNAAGAPLTSSLLLDSSVVMRSSSQQFFSTFNNYAGSASSSSSSSLRREMPRRHTLLERQRPVVVGSTGVYKTESALGSQMTQQHASHLVSPLASSSTSTSFSSFSSSTPNSAIISSTSNTSYAPLPAVKTSLPPILVSDSREHINGRRTRHSSLSFSSTSTRPESYQKAGPVVISTSSTPNGADKHSPSDLFSAASSGATFQSSSSSYNHILDGNFDQQADQQLLKLMEEEKKKKKKASKQGQGTNSSQSLSIRKDSLQSSNPSSALLGYPGYSSSSPHKYGAFQPSALGSSQSTPYSSSLSACRYQTQLTPCESPETYHKRSSASKFCSSFVKFITCCFCCGKCGISSDEEDLCHTNEENGYIDTRFGSGKNYGISNGSSSSSFDSNGLSPTQ